MNDAESLDHINAEEIVKAISEEFQNSEQTVAAKDVAPLLGVLAAQQDALGALYAMIGKAAPHLVLAPQGQAVERAILLCSRTFLDAAVNFSTMYSSEEDVE